MIDYYINWLPSSEVTFNNELEFILEKWNIKEVDKFSDLVNESIIRLSINPFIGNYRKDLDTYSFVISKQTTLFYDILENKHQIDLLLFWNNIQNPKFLGKYINENK